VVNIHMLKHAKDSEFEYKYFFLDVKGHPRIYLENAESTPPSSDKKKVKLFGVNWG
jgi:mitochondrial import inner membrane translocase subunit TIM21